MSPWSKKVRSLLSRKQHASKDSPVSSADNSHTPEIDTNAPRLPPEILSLIVKQLPLASLWSIRGTCREWNTLAMKEAWKAISKPTLVLDTTIHDPIDHGCMILGNSLSLVELSTSSESVKKGALRTTRATWCRRHINTYSSPDREVSYTYEPGFLHLLPRPQRSTTEFNMEKLSVSYGRLKDFRRIESWSSNTKGQSSFTALFSSKGGKKSRQQHGLADHRLDWNITYLAEYHMDSLGQYPPVYRLRKLALLEVSVPISQLVGGYLSEFSDDSVNRTDGLDVEPFNI